MKTLIVLAFVLVGNNLFAEKFGFTYFGNEGRNRVFLSCDYAQSSSESLLEKLGLENIKVSCTGGIMPGGAFFPVSVKASFDFPEESVNAVIKSNGSNCYYDTKFLNTLTREFKNDFKVNKSTGHCFRSDSRYHFDIETL